jgi:D-2-hydroxyacid dehydrogenase (NADP+)
MPHTAQAEVRRGGPSVLVIDHYAGDYARHLAEAFPELTIHTAPDVKTITTPLDGIDILVAFGVAIDEPLMAGCTNLKWIQSLATGVDHFLKSPSLKPTTLLTSARGIHGAPMRETVALLILGVTRDVHRLVKNQQSKIWERGTPWPLLAGSSALVAGSGVSGSAIGALLQAFGMTTTVATHAPRAVDGFNHAVHMRDLARAAATADFVIDVLPGSAQYAHVFNRGVFEAMKPTAFFINVGRGETVDEAALIDCLSQRRIAGAGLDVVAKSPLSASSPLWTLPNVLLSPHIGGYFAAYESHMMPILIENMRHFLAGRAAGMRNAVEH